MVNERQPPKDTTTNKNKTMDSINTQRVEKLLKKTEGRRISVVPANAPDGPKDAPTPGDIKNFPDPPVFTGEITDGKDISLKFEPWVLHVHDKLQMNQDHFKTDAAKTAYVFTRLSGDAMDHINSYCAGDPNYFKTSDSVLNTLWEIYDNPNQ
ncbi:hypothetical protein LPUS_02866 [Lasallia pustulata]|uniref:Uncharacterized protein n=1 Tax=Lasallia pustulata TaxID=136370 RepID=A0A1W5CU13_9LECA|nr:hypothetical protein LPUS_02866 [Lasallia pustulata]